MRFINQRRSIGRWFGQETNVIGAAARHSRARFWIAGVVGWTHECVRAQRKGVSAGESPSFFKVPGDTSSWISREAESISSIKQN